MKRGHAAALVLMFALAGCGGSGGDSGGGSGDRPGGDPGAAGTSPSPAASATASGKGKPDAPVPPAQSKAVKAFSECMRKQGVELPTPNPGAAPSATASLGQREIKKRMTAMQTCMKALGESPSLR